MSPHANAEHDNVDAVFCLGRCCCSAFLPADAATCGTQFEDLRSSHAECACQVSDSAYVRQNIARDKSCLVVYHNLLEVFRRNQDGEH